MLFSSSSSYDHRNSSPSSNLWNSISLLFSNGCEQSVSNMVPKDCSPNKGKRRTQNRHSHTHHCNNRSNHHHGLHYGLNYNLNMGCGGGSSSSSSSSGNETLTTRNNEEGSSPRIGKGSPLRFHWRRKADQWKWWTGAATVFFMAIMVYWNSLHGDFVHDDIVTIVRNPDVRSSSWDLWWNDYWGMSMSNHLSHKSYRPLTILTFR